MPRGKRKRYVVDRLSKMLAVGNAALLRSLDATATHSDRKTFPAPVNDFSTTLEEAECLSPGPKLFGGENNILRDAKLNDGGSTATPTPNRKQSRSRRADGKRPATEYPDCAQPSVEQHPCQTPSRPPPSLEEVIAQMRSDGNGACISPGGSLVFSGNGHDEMLAALEAASHFEARYRPREPPAKGAEGSNTDDPAELMTPESEWNTITTEAATPEHAIAPEAVTLVLKHLARQSEHSNFTVLGLVNHNTHAHQIASLCSEGVTVFGFIAWREHFALVMIEAGLATIFDSARGHYQQERNDLVRAIGLEPVEGECRQQTELRSCGIHTTSNFALLMCPRPDPEVFTRNWFASTLKEALEERGIWSQDLDLRARKDATRSSTGHLLASERLRQATLSCALATNHERGTTVNGTLNYADSGASTPPPVFSREATPIPNRAPTIPATRHAETNPATEKKMFFFFAFLLPSIEKRKPQEVTKPQVTPLPFCKCEW